MATVIGAHPWYLEWKTGAHFFHCRAHYVYVVNGTIYQNSFSTRAGKLASAQEFASSVQNQCVLIKYDPNHPGDSVLESPKILDREVIQANHVLNPRVW